MRVPSTCYGTTVHFFGTPEKINRTEDREGASRKDVDSKKGKPAAKKWEWKQARARQTMLPKNVPTSEKSGDGIDVLLTGVLHAVDPPYKHFL